MKNVIKWFAKSNRWKHLAGGMLIGIFADGDYCAAYAGIGVASALEMKDWQWCGQWDWIDWSLTVGGVFAGRLIRIAI